MAAPTRIRCRVVGTHGDHLVVVVVWPSPGPLTEGLTLCLSKYALPEDKRRPDSIVILNQRGNSFDFAGQSVSPCQ